MRCVANLEGKEAKNAESWHCMRRPGSCVKVYKTPPPPPPGSQPMMLAMSDAIKS